MLKNVDEYLVELKKELNGSDIATVQDALADAEDHLRTAVIGLREHELGMAESDALQIAIEQYGTPSETAAAYIEV